MKTVSVRKLFISAEEYNHGSVLADSVIPEGHNAAVLHEAEQTEVQLAIATVRQTFINVVRISSRTRYAVCYKLSRTFTVVGQQVCQGKVHMPCLRALPMLQKQAHGGKCSLFCSAVPLTANDNNRETATTWTSCTVQPVRSCGSTASPSLHGSSSIMSNLEKHAQGRPTSNSPRMLTVSLSGTTNSHVESRRSKIVLV